MEFLVFGEIFRGAERANIYIYLLYRLIQKYTHIQASYYIQIIHDKYNIDYVKYKHTHKSKNG